jgi:excisionase family DNA binding protein
VAGLVCRAWRRDVCRRSFDGAVVSVYLFSVMNLRTGKESGCQRVLTTSEVADLLGVSRMTLWRYLARHRCMGFVTSHGYRFFRKSDVAVLRRVMSR